MNESNVFYCCPNHQKTSGYEPCCSCGGWSEDEIPRLCSENTDEQDDLLLVNSEEDCK